MPVINDGGGKCIGATEDELASLSLNVPIRLLDVQKQGESGISSSDVDPSLAMILAVEMGIVEVQ